MSNPVVVQATYENGILRPTHPLDLNERQVVQIRLEAEATTDHPHVTKTPGVCGGRPVVRGTRIPVKVLVRYHQLGYKSTEILSGHVGLTPAQLYDVLSYYYDHQAEMEADIKADELPALLNAFGMEMDANGALHLTG